MCRFAVLLALITSPAIAAYTSAEQAAYEAALRVAELDPLRESVAIVYETGSGKFDFDILRTGAIGGKVTTHISRSSMRYLVHNHPRNVYTGMVQYFSEADIETAKSLHLPSIIVFGRHHEMRIFRPDQDKPVRMKIQRRVLYISEGSVFNPPAHQQ